jgi:hypothetical protein
MTITRLPARAEKSIGSAVWARRAAGLDPCRQHQLAGEQGAWAIGVQDRGGQQIPAGRHADESGPVAHGDAQDAAEPGQIGLPVLARDGVDRGERGGTVLSLVPGLKGQTRQAQVRPADELGRAQRAHARIAQPDALAPFGVLVHQQDVAHLLAQQGGRHGQPALAGADDHNVQHALASRNPVAGGVGDQGQVAGDIVFQLGQTAGPHPKRTPGASSRNRI